MKLKTFFISYLLFLSILLGALGTISIYLTNHQMQTLNEQSHLEYERIASMIEREVNIVYERGVGQTAIDALLESYVNFHENRNILLSIDWVIISSDDLELAATSTFISDDQCYLISVESYIVTTPISFLLTAAFDVTESVHELREIQRILLYLFIVFSLFSAVILYFILNKIFKPLEIVTTSAQKIANGEYSERIVIKGKNELALMADQFNQMASEIENRIYLLEEEAERKQQFMDNLAHEIRTPLTAIYGYAEYIQKANLNEEEKIESTMYVMEEAIYMKKITNSMLELAALRNHTIKKEEISIIQLFNQLATTLEASFHEYQVELIIEALDEVIVGQEDLIRSLILNLCINAGKACMPANTNVSNMGEIVIKAEKKLNQLVISVKDNGCGMSVEDVEKVTEPFYQVDKARNRAAGGIGLGLTLCKEIAQLHDARLIIESELGVGTTVKVIFTTS